MDARFELISPAGKVWREDDFDVGGDQFPQEVAALTPLYGVLVLSGDDGTETTITDDFDAMLQEICLRSIGQMSRGERVDYRLAAHAETVTFAPEGDRVRIGGDVRNELVCNRDDLVEALLDCGERFVDFKAAQLGPASGAYYRAELDRARASVSA
ncbi:hypothetical protein GC209_16860 [bacterium]|nr:hypothetical protein [bacterium]